MGDIFGFLHLVKLRALEVGINVFADDAIWLDWRWAPLLHLHHGPRGPWLLQGIPLSNLALTGLITATLAAALSLALILTRTTKSGAQAAGS
jgi:hypothetical protein